MKGGIYTIVLLLFINVINAQSKTGKPVKDNSKKYEKVIAKNKVVVVDFWATWCGPCRKVSPIIDELKEEYKGQVEVIKVNVDHHKVISKKYGVKNIPTVLVIRKEKVEERIVGARSKMVYKELIERNL